MIIVFLIFNSTCSLLLYRKVIKFYILTLSPTTLPQSFISFRSLWILSYFLHMQTCHLWTKTVLCFLSLSFFFFYLIALARTFNTMLKRSKRGHPCFNPALSGKASNFLPLRMILGIGFLFCFSFVCLFL